MSWPDTVGSQLWTMVFGENRELLVAEWVSPLGVDGGGGGGPR